MTDWRSRKIIAAACLHNGVVYSLAKPARHHDVLKYMDSVEIYQDGTTEQGFLTDGGEFVRRKPACMIAKNAGQLNVHRTKTDPQDMLFSEDLW